MAQLFSNAARAELSSSINDTDASLTIKSGGSKYPVANTGSSAISPSKDWFKLVIQDETGIEIIYCRTHTSGSNTFSNLLRGQEDTVARSFSPDAIVGIRPTAGDSAKFEAKQDTESGKGLSQEDFTTTLKDKLDNIESNAQVNDIPVANLVSTDNTKPLAASQGKILKDLVDTIDSLLQSDDAALDELQEIVDFIKLNRSDLNALSIASIAGLSSALAGKQPLAAVLTGTTSSFTTALKNKLDGVEAGATANDTDINLKNRANHSGEQAQSTITGLITALGLLAPKASPVLTGTPTAPTAAEANDTTQLATTAFVQRAVGNIGVPEKATISADGLMSKEDKVKLNAVGTMANRDVTVSEDPPGIGDGADGDIWLQV